MKKAILLSVLLVSCGTAVENEPEGPKPYPTPTPSGTPTPGGDDFTARVKPVMDKNCTKCHDGVIQKPKFDSAASFKNSNSKRRIENGTMPPGGGISETDKQILLDFLK